MDILAAETEANGTANKSVQTIRVRFLAPRSEFVDKIFGIFQRQVQEHCGAVVKLYGGGELTVELALDAAIGNATNNGMTTLPRETAGTQPPGKPNARIVVCPSIPEGHDYLMRLWDQTIDTFLDDEVVEAIDILEGSLTTNYNDPHRDKLSASVCQAYELIKEADTKLSVQARNSWRWRILYLRAMIDCEMFNSDGKPEGAVLKQAFDEYPLNS